MRGLVLICIPSCEGGDLTVSLPKIMAPFEVYDGTGDNTYVKSIPVSIQESWDLSLPQIDHKILDRLPNVPERWRYSRGYRVIGEDGQPSHAIRRCNPDGRWDYFIDAPWPHKLITMTGKRVNACRVSDLSVHQLAKVNAYRAEVEFRVWESCLAGCPTPKPYPSFGGDSTAFMAQEAIENYYEAVEARMLRRVKGCPVEYFGFEELSYIERAGDAMFRGHDLLIGGSWRSQPPDMPDRVWTQEVLDTLQSQPGDDWIAIQLYSS